MKVLQANKAYAPTIGGVETIVRTLAEGLHRMDGVSVEVLACKPQLSLRSHADLVHGVPVTYAASMGTVSSMPLSPSYAWRLARAKSDIIHVHAPFPLTDLALLYSPWQRGGRTPVVVSWHSDVVRQKRALAVYRPLLLSFLKRVDAIVVSTPYHITSSHVLPAFREKCHIIPYGLELDWARDGARYSAISDQLRMRLGEPIILFVGRLVYYKGVEYLIEAMREVPRGKLLIVGQGPIEQEIRQKLDAYGLHERVSIVPPMPVEELRAYFHACDVLVLPSILPSEAFGLVLVEAMACGKPVVSTALGTGISYVNRDRQSGLVVPPRDSGALANAINELVANPQLRERLGEMGRRRALEEFTQESMVARTVALYRQLLLSHKREQ